MIYAFLQIPYHNVTDGRTDRRTDVVKQYRALCWRAIKTLAVDSCYKYVNLKYD